MEEASTARAASLEAVEDVESVPLGDEIRRVIDRAPMTPGALTILTARELGDGTAEPDPDPDLDPGPDPDVEAAAARRAAGVQLSYEGLRLTRQLIREDHRWGADDPSDSHVALLVGEVMVSRGFFYLARTPVAPDAIEIVRRFSRNQMREREFDADAAELETSLEFDVIELAVAAGATVVTEDVPPAVEELAGELACELDTEPLPAPAEALEGVPERIETRLGAHSPAATEDHSRAVDGSW